MPSTPWGGRRATDSPRPAGRWAGRLRRSGSLARQVLAVRVGRRRATGPRRAETGQATAGGQGTLLLRPPHTRQPHGHRGHPALDRPAQDRPDDPAPWHPPRHPDLDPLIVAPVSPAVPVVTRPAASVPLLPGPATPGRRARFALVNGCTVSSLLLGMTAVFLALHGSVQPAALCLLGCVGVDGVDGALARRLGVASPFGVQMDSLADMCSFGIAAPVVVYCWLRVDAPDVPMAGACALVAACAAIRLARFNVSPRDGRFFTGVPTTMVAAVLGLGTLIGLHPTGTAAAAVVAALALAMVTSFPYAKLARIAKLPPWLWIAPVVGAVVDYRVTFAVAVVAYFASGPIIWLRRHL